MKCGDRLDGFELLEELGRGGMGIVFRARELALERDVALKVLLPGLASKPHYVQRFQREARIIAALRHPHIVSVLSYGEAGGRYYFAMEYVAGLDLARYLKQRGTLPVPEALSITTQVAEALQEASAHGVTHRDIKPSNIIIDERGSALITDFGIARFRESQDDLTRTGGFFGTPEYAAPELAKGDPVDVRTDIYSLGAVLYRMLAGVPPVSGDSALATMLKASTEGATPIARVKPSLPATLCELVDRMLALEPTARPQTPRELLGALEACRRGVAGETGTQLEKTVVVEASNLVARQRRSRGLRFGAGLGALLAGVSLVWALRGDPAGQLPERPVPVPDEAYPPGPWLEETAAGPGEAAAVAGQVASPPAAVSPPAPSRPPALPPRPRVLVAVFGDETLVPLVRSQLASAFLSSDLEVAAITEVTRLRASGRIGDLPWSTRDVERFVPTDDARIIVLAQIQKTGTTPLSYMGRRDELTHATFAVQTLDASTGRAIHADARGGIQFTELNMHENLERAVAPVVREVGASIDEYWTRIREETGASGSG